MPSLVRVGAVDGHPHEQPENRQGCREDGDCGTHAPSADGVSRGDGEDGGGEVGSVPGLFQPEPAREPSALCCGRVDDLFEAVTGVGVQSLHNFQQVGKLPELPCGGGGAQILRFLGQLRVQGYSSGSRTRMTEVPPLVTMIDGIRSRTSFRCVTTPLTRSSSMASWLPVTASWRGRAYGRRRSL